MDESSFTLVEKTDANKSDTVTQDPVTNIIDTVTDSDITMDSKSLRMSKRLHSTLNETPPLSSKRSRGTLEKIQIVKENTKSWKIRDSDRSKSLRRRQNNTSYDDTNLEDGPSKKRRRGDKDSAENRKTRCRSVGPEVELGSKWRSDLPEFSRSTPDSDAAETRAMKLTRRRSFWGLNESDDQGKGDNGVSSSSDVGLATTSRRATKDANPSCSTPGKQQPSLRRAASTSSNITPVQSQSPASRKRTASISNNTPVQSPSTRRMANSSTKGTPVQEMIGFGENHCWQCHERDGTVQCSTCPRQYHKSCVSLSKAPSDYWSCPECDTIMYHENTATRSETMNNLTLDQLCKLLQFTLERMKNVPESEPFWKAVDVKFKKEYEDVIKNPMHLELLEKKIESRMYGSTQAFLADAKWIEHNSIVFNLKKSLITNKARAMLRVCQHELNEIDICPDCYLNAHTETDWFIQVCRKPHLLVYAKLKGHPYWPAKAMSFNPKDQKVDTRFFGAHDRSWIPAKDCYLLSQDCPVPSMKRRLLDLEESLGELHQHVEKLRQIHGEFVYAPDKAPLDLKLWNKHIEDMLPGWQPRNKQSRRKRTSKRRFVSSTIVSEETVADENASVVNSSPEDEVIRNLELMAPASIPIDSLHNDTTSETFTDLDETESNPIPEHGYTKSTENLNETPAEKAKTTSESPTLSDECSTILDDDDMGVIDKSDMPDGVETNEKMGDAELVEESNILAPTPETKTIIRNNDNAEALPVVAALATSVQETKTIKKKKIVDSEVDVEDSTILNEAPETKTVMRKTSANAETLSDVAVVATPVQEKERDKTADETEKTVNNVVSNVDKPKDNETVKTKEAAKNRKKLNTIKPSNTIETVETADSSKICEALQKRGSVQIADGSKAPETLQKPKTVEIVDGSNASEELQKTETVLTAVGLKASNALQKTEPAPIADNPLRAAEASKKAEIVENMKAVTEEKNSKSTSPNADLKGTVKRKRQKKTKLTTQPVQDDIETPPLISLSPEPIHNPDATAFLDVQVKPEEFEQYLEEENQAEIEEESDHRNAVSVSKPTKSVFINTTSRISKSTTPSSSKQENGLRDANAKLRLSDEVSLHVVGEGEKKSTNQNEKSAPEPKILKNPKARKSIPRPVTISTSSNDVSVKNASKNLNVISVDTKNSDAQRNLLKSLCLEEKKKVDKDKPPQKSGISPVIACTTASNLQNINGPIYIAQNGPAMFATNSLGQNLALPSGLSQVNLVHLTNLTSGIPTNFINMTNDALSYNGPVNTVYSGPPPLTVSSNNPVLVKSTTVPGKKSPPKGPFISVKNPASMGVVPGNSSPVPGGSDNPENVPGTHSFELAQHSQTISSHVTQTLVSLLKSLGSEGVTEAKYKSILIEKEKVGFKYKQEIASLKREIAQAEMDKQKALTEQRQQFEKVIAETKRKQWCAHCGNEALFYCCWNTSYCGYNCQQEHWRGHMNACAQLGNRTTTVTSVPVAMRERSSNVIRRQDNPSHIVGQGSNSIRTPNGTFSGVAIASYPGNGVGPMYNGRPSSSDMYRIPERHLNRPRNNVSR